MSMLVRATNPKDAGIPTRIRTGNGTKNSPTADDAMRHSAVWACLRLRNDLVSTMPVDVFRRVEGIQVEMPKPPVLITPGGTGVEYHEWNYSSGVDTDRAGNCFGLITARDALGYPAIIELQDLASVSVTIRDGKVHKYRFRNAEYDPPDVWHEKQFTVSGLPIGLSPISYAAYSIGQYLSAQQFAIDWFGSGGRPAGVLKNNAKTISPTDANAVKEQYKATVGNGELFVTGSDWEYKPMVAVQSDTNWIDTQQYGIPDICRFFGAPADLIDAAVSGGGSINYANITQRNLQFLIMNLGPKIFRREVSFTNGLLPKPRFAKINRDAVLAMDPETRAKVIGQKIKDRTMTPSEARALDNLPPLTDQDIAEFDRLFGAPNKSTPAVATSGVTQ